MTRRLCAAVLLAGVSLSAASALAQPAPIPGSRLRVLTINAWSGLDYEDTSRFGEYEPRARREQRFAILVDQIKAIAPDIVYLQEANPVGPYAARLARALGYSEIHQVENAGIKLGPIGIPSNFKEGMAILARPSFQLRRHDVWKLSGPPGVLGDALTFHLGEEVSALVGKILVDDTPVYLVNVHLVAAASDDQSVAVRFRETPEGRGLTETEFAAVGAENRARNQRRLEEAQKLIRRIERLPKGCPVIVAGDFNADPDSPAVRAILSASDMVDATPTAGAGAAAETAATPITWDARSNQNIAYSSRPTNAKGQPRGPRGLLDAFDSLTSRRLDYIVLHERFGPEDVIAASVVLDKPIDGVHPSDHYGVIADIEIGRAFRESPKEPGTVVRPDGFGKEFFPIAMWDTDIGFGYGAKAFLLNPFGHSESFDLTAFNSTKGERWYRFAFSMPDLETRQGKQYPLAVDVTLDYDKMIKNNFFGVGSASRFADRVTYTREPLVTNVTLSRGFGRTVGQIGVKYTSIRNRPAESGEEQAPLPSALDLGHRSYVSMFGAVRYDSRESFTNPSQGIVLQGEAEVSPSAKGNGVRFGRVAGWFQSYSVLFFPKTVFGLRVGGQSLFGDHLPVHVLLPLGGANNLRGSPQDRYLDKSHVLVNAELRFPLVGRAGGVIGVDVGKAWPSLSQMDLKRWALNPAFGLRYYMMTFVVRMDIGLGRETTGFYFNFGHLF